jgi:formylglycine-generating enzyme required for sulfatase activity
VGQNGKLPGRSKLPGGIDPLGAEGSSRVLRGGTRGLGASAARCACRGSFIPGDGYRLLGFRAVLAPGQP